MAKREYTVRLRCGHAGCEDYGHYSCSTRAEQADLQRRYHPDRWRCVRHTRPDEVLSLERPIRTTTQTVFAKSHGNYWGIDKAVCGFIYGPGFKAYACDFPAGTLIKITAEVIPSDQQKEARDGTE